MSRGERIDMMHKRFEWLSNLARSCPTLEDFCNKYDDYLGIIGIELKRKELNIDVCFCAHECEIYSIVPNISGIQVSSIILWQNELCANEEIDILNYDMQIESHKNGKSSYSDQFLPHYIDAYKVIIAGGRDFDNYEYMCGILNNLLYNSTYFGSGRIHGA